MYSFHLEFAFVWEFFNRFPFSHLFAPARHSRSIVTNARKSPPPRMKREPWFCKKSFIQHGLWLDLIRVTRCDQTCISVTVMMEVDPTPPLAATLHSSSGGQKTCVSKFFRFDCFPQRQFQLIRNPKMVHWDLEDLLPLLNKSTANNFSDLCVKELYPRRVLNKNWQSKEDPVTQFQNQHLFTTTISFEGKILHLWER